MDLTANSWIVIREEEVLSLPNKTTVAATEENTLLTALTKEAEEERITDLLQNQPSILGKVSTRRQCFPTYSRYSTDARRSTSMATRRRRGLDKPNYWRRTKED